MHKNKNEGVISIEASIAIVLFLFMMLFFYSLFYMTIAHHMIAHALTQASQSMSLDTYESKVFTADKDALLGANNLGQVINGLLGAVGADNGYVSTKRWYDTDKNDVLQSVAKARFVSYFAESEKEADERLKALGVESGLSGLDFSESKASGSDVYIIVKFNIEPWINFFHLPSIQMKMQSRSRMWG